MSHVFLNSKIKAENTNVNPTLLKVRKNYHNLTFLYWTDGHGQ